MMLCNIKPSFYILQKLFQQMLFHILCETHCELKSRREKEAITLSASGFASKMLQLTLHLGKKRFLSE